VSVEELDAPRGRPVRSTRLLPSAKLVVDPTHVLDERKVRDGVGREPLARPLHLGAEVDTAGPWSLERHAHGGGHCLVDGGGFLGWASLGQ
jgi:hypothetical protein